MAKRITTKTKTKAPKPNREAQAMVVQAYWNNDQACKQAKSRRDKMHDLALLAVPKGTTAGPAYDDNDGAHWLTHGEKEIVEIDPLAVLHAMRISPIELLGMCRLDAARLRQLHPRAYARALKLKSTVHTTHDVLTWADRRPPLRGAKSRPRAKSRSHR